MNRITLGVICGLVFGSLDVLIMIPLKFDNPRKKYEAMSSAFLERFMTGFIIPNINLGIHPALTGGLLGVGFSVPTAIITRTYLPIIGTGIVGGVIIGFVSKLII
ncbi:MAG: hypothetical protein A2452_01545 [Candidatus Firestonebacteria bacterium RIFOXYC2_FULL_39_67]|nr:MAG: hypothetical protein A2536_05790 [Candidatus Firestonebacteria bacterium RIFOXYD2_FULL_39_29]OGF54196.1 MAG: hypothetical protein A2452_01545 [Candidatus Firestonebacteria bacterium RIFOXYC2_FULL_39_67]OGF57678.1 MAG: hypothetical protein A2497_03515 [Candidatus Firestonebacteria bacterium RifOxyC12_full_39_7]